MCDVTNLTLMLSALATGLGLIVAVGAQNAYLLRQGLRREHVGPLVLLCVTADWLLIGLAVLGIGVVTATWPGFMTLARWGGGLFLIGYGLSAARRALRPGSTLTAEGAAPTTLRRALLTMAAMTYLNPHLYLDVVLLGAIANSHGETGRWWVYVGFGIASTIWFMVLGFGAKLLAPWFSSPRAWQVLDGLIAVLITALGVGLIVTG